MKTSIIYLGVFALTVFTTCNAENVVNKELLNQNQQQITNLFLVNEQNENLVATTDDSKFSLLKDTNIAEDEVATSSITTTYARAIEEVIAEDNLITESPEEEVQVAPFDETVLKVISEDNKIIESPKADEFNPLDFEFINQNIIPNVKVELGIINLEKSDIKY